MIAINEYYFYHRDTPSIFHKGVERAYKQWGQRRERLQYRQLKQALNLQESKEEANEDRKDNHRRDRKDQPDCTSLLKDISEYNPKSGKYYLRKANGANKRAQDNTSLESIERELQNLLSRCSFAEDLSLMRDQNHSKDQKEQRESQ